MGRFGFSKKGDDGDDANRSALFSRKKDSPAPQSDNPYAKQAANDPYADNKSSNMTAYQKARSDLGNSPSQVPPPPYSNDTQYGGNQYGSSQPPANDKYGRAPTQGYGNDKYGSGGGYGSNRYDSNPGQDRYGTQTSGTRGPGGYGGFGRGDEPDDNRDALLSGAQQRYDHKQQSYSAGDSAPTAASGESTGGYGGYGEERELTQEEQEDAEYQAILAEKRQLQQESASSVNRSVQMARQANEVGRATLARLGAQGERLHNTEKHLDLAANQNKIAQDRAAELKTLNRSMFAVHVSNPFTAKSRQLKADEEVLSRHQAERAEREATRKDGFAATQRMESNFRDMNTSASARPRQARKKDYGKYNLDDEEGADELEDQIDDGLNELEGQVSMMNMVGRAIGKEVDTQNKQIDRIMNKVRHLSVTRLITDTNFYTERSCG